MSLFKRRADNAEQIQALRAEVKAMSARLAQADQVRADQVRADQVRAESVTADQTPVSTSKPEPLTAVPVRGHDIASIVARIELLAQRLDETNARITAVSTELAAQIDEVGRDGIPIEQLREAQVQLANAQARYQIQFNEGLAELADRLRDREAAARDASDVNDR